MWKQPLTERVQWLNINFNNKTVYNFIIQDMRALFAKYIYVSAYEWNEIEFWWKRMWEIKEKRTKDEKAKNANYYMNSVRPNKTKWL